MLFIFLFFFLLMRRLPPRSTQSRSSAASDVYKRQTYNKASSLFISYLTMLLATVYFASLAFFVMEHKVNPLVVGYGDALWWAFMDVTTVGSNIIAVTATGRVLSVLLAALGMMMFPIFTVYVTSLIQKKNKEKDEYYEQLASEKQQQQQQQQPVADK